MAFLIKHGEKIVAAVFAMLGCLALSSANWATTDQSPIALEKTATENKSKIELNDWPEEDKSWFQEIPDVLKITSEEGGQIVDISDYQLLPFRSDLNQAKEKRASVAVLAPLEPRAVAVVFPLAMPPDEEEAVEEDLGKVAGADGAVKSDDAPLTEEEEAAKLLAEKFGLRPADAVATGGLGGGAAEYAGGSEGYTGGASSEEYAQQMQEGYGGSEGYGGGGGYGSDYGMEMYETYGQDMMNVQKKKIRVSAGVSATMIIDLQKQREIVRKALHLKGNYLIAQNEILYVDLLVERRSLGQKNGNWEPVSSEDLGEILKESLGFDRDVVSPAITRSAITMPLPRRAAGVWLASQVSHPRVEDFELSREEKELIDKFNQMVTAKITEAEEAAPIEVAPRGFSGFAQSATEMSAYGSGGMGADYEQMYDEYEGSMGESSGGAGSTPFKLTDAEKQLLDATKATAEHRLLLVRFMDFTVERGKSYEYRARVVMKNPNYDHPLDELEDPGLAAEPELVSDWSEATNPVFVPFGSRTYVTEVDAREGQQEKATLQVYSDTTETGLSVMGDVRVFVGMPVAGQHALEVVDLTSDTLETRDVTLKSDELLAAAEELNRLSSSDHPELKSMIDALPDRAIKPIPDQVTVVDNTGALKLRSSGDMSQQQAIDHAEYTGILKIYEPWKKKAAGPESSDFFGGSGSEEMMESDSYGLGMEAASSSSYQGGTAGSGGRRMSSREEARKRRSGELPPRGAGMSGGSSE